MRISTLQAAFAATAVHGPNLPHTKYSIQALETGPWGYPDDTPAYNFIDKDGVFYQQSSDGEYELWNERIWRFYRGTNADDGVLAEDIVNYVDPAEPRDTNADTTWRCNYRSPTGCESTWDETPGTRFSQRNYCDLIGLWVDPDTGDWHGLIHNEFTPAPFGDRLHFDAIDFAVSKNQGKTWDISHHILTSPYPTVRNDSSTFPEQTYYWGNGDQRLIVDHASGYFYVTYGSRIVDKGGSWVAFHEHVARAPMSGKLGGGWQKWYNGSWSQPGNGGRESNLVPVDKHSKTGYTPPSEEYDPSNKGNASEQVSKGLVPPTTPLFWMDVSFSPHLGIWIGQPNNVDTSGNAPQEYYACDDLTTQKWYKIGDSGEYRTNSQYRWFIDGASKTSQIYVGKHVRGYCSFGCSGGSASEYINLEFDTAHPPHVVDTGKKYRLEADGKVLREGDSVDSNAAKGHKGHKEDPLALWHFTPTGDGAYTISNSATGDRLAVDSDDTSSRAWGTPIALQSAESESESEARIGQQWWIIPNRSPATNEHTGSFRVINRYSGLALALSTAAETTPVRSWTDVSGSSVGGGRRAEAQAIRLTPVV